MNDQEQQFKTGFNNGYLLAKHESGLINTITKNLHVENNYVDGLIAGKEEYELELTKELDELQKLRDKSIDRDRDLTL